MMLAVFWNDAVYVGDNTCEEQRTVMIQQSPMYQLRKVILSILWVLQKVFRN